mmetsp:Transcript_25969/g.61743  ORF Transcript_25969/g.61743 Transcript_25969/m.61743 type:complete len:1026 (+) Transcript_25969:173-3250(+)
MACSSRLKRFGSLAARAWAPSQNSGLKWCQEVPCTLESVFHVDVYSSYVNAGTGTASYCLGRIFPSQSRAISSGVSVGAETSEQPKPVPLSKLKDSFLDGTSSSYLENLEERYRRDPGSVDRTWASFFRMQDGGVHPEAVAEAFHAWEMGTTTVSPLSLAATSNQTIQESMKLLTLVRSYQVNGHLEAKLDPLDHTVRPAVELLDPKTYGFSEADMDREFYVGTWDTQGFLSEQRPVRTLREMVNCMREAYCNHTGIEYMHIADRQKCNWIRERVELYTPFQYPAEMKKRILDRLMWSEMFETFLANKYAATKRFGLEGGESIIPGMKALVDQLALEGAESCTFGMAHRGRLNVLANVVRKPLAQIFHEFAGMKPAGSEDDYSGSGDVKYHLGTSYTRPTIHGGQVYLSLMANPSHLEAVNTVVLGKVRAKQHYTGDTEGRRHVPILVHGDGSFAGQGIVYETLDMSQLPDFQVGGCIHIVINNQVAFTTDPKKSRSSVYCTDVAKSLECPIFHVNGDDVEAVCRAMELAASWRQKWKTDVVIDVVCYRKYGHNEIDEPMFTQPALYDKIKKHNSAMQQYMDKIVREGIMTQEQVEAAKKECLSVLGREFENGKDYKPQKSDWLSERWSGFLSPAQRSRIRNTGVPDELLQEVGKAITTLPESFHFHRQVKKVYDQRRAMMEGKEGVDWGMAEALALGTLLAEGNHVRLSGQDVERGTFSHRHAVLHDQRNFGDTYTPLKHVYSQMNPKDFIITNSSLSEYGVLGFELGYSMENPNSLILWEAQFGDFANGAQIIFDQFLSAGEAKWLRQSGLTCLLPHGYDGQGPEHSSARMERFLQMCDEHPYTLPDMAQTDEEWFSGRHLGNQIQNTNWQITNVTTPANYFHLLRRQVHRQFRKPLINFSPKNLLRHPMAKSPIWEFDDLPDDAGIQGVRFKRLIMDVSSTDRSPRPPEQPSFKRIVMCSGKVYYELLEERKKRELDDQVALVRVEQLNPFPFDLVMREIRRFPNAEFVWCQVLLSIPVPGC